MCLRCLNRDSLCFKSGEFGEGGEDNWTANAANLKKLNNCMEAYLETVLKLPIEKDYIDTQAIAKEDDRINMLRLCERVLGIIGNSKVKEMHVDTILNLGETQQAILMDVMLKYVKPDNKAAMQFDPELAEPFQTKEADSGLVAYITKLENENKELAAKLGEVTEKYSALTASNKQLQDEFMRKIRVADPIAEVHSAREEELENEASALKSQLNSVKGELETQRKEFEEQKVKLKDEIFIANQKVLKLSGLEKLVEQQREQIESLQVMTEEKTSAETKVEACEMKIQELEKSKKEIIDECKKLTSDFCAEKNEYKEIVKNGKKVAEKLKKMELELVTAEDKKSYWEKRTKEAEEKLRVMQEENDTLRLSATAGNLLSHEQELKYIKRIEKLEEQVELLVENSSSKLAAKVGELEEQLETTTTAKNKNEQEFLLLTKQHDELQKEHNDALEQLECYKLDKSSTIDMTQEYVKVKKDKDALMRAVDDMSKQMAGLEGLKRQLAEATAESRGMREKYERLRKEKEGAEQQMREKADKNMELEKSVVRLEEKISILQEERKKTEQLIKNVIQQSDSVLHSANIGTRA
eukprot:TRINITY_DN5923_c0_g3_i2.p1 TRINITY_DN5923_c0_g3~~TRINITY_DN5923_c0_g3_i2.p1  ORF type:complete len:583 (-),score=237.80 TRINITY_DN5923_c0_g3_i2:204-1952(-)